METNEVPTDDGIIGNSETGVQDAEEAKVGGVEEVEEESNVSFFNDSSLGEFEFEEKEPAVGDDIPAEGAAEDGPALSEVDEVEEEINADKEANKGEEEEEEAAPSKEAILEKLRKGGAMNVLADFPLPKEDQERDMVEEESNESLTERASGTLDLKASEYFTKYPKAIANPQVSDSFQLFCLSLPKERSLKLFNEDAEGLPEGWKVQS